MESDGAHDLDVRLEELQSALNRVRAPRSIEENVVSQLGQLAAENPVRPKNPSNWWVSIGLAASVGIIMIAFGLPQLPWELPVEEVAFEPVSGFVVARTQVPVRVHSLSRGAELHYLDSHMIRDERGLTRIVYVQLTEKD